MHDLNAAKAVLGELRDAGVRIALDDFGTGYSSLYHLRNFKLDTIKIDRSFIEAMATDHDSDAIVRALVGLGLGLAWRLLRRVSKTSNNGVCLSIMDAIRARGSSMVAPYPRWRHFPFCDQ